MRKSILVISMAILAVFVAIGFVSCADEPYIVARVSEWDGVTATTEWYTANKDADEFIIGSASDLAGLAELVNGGSTRSAESSVDFTGKTIKLDTDIDLQGKAWTPIGQKGVSHNFSGIFDGNGHEIRNLFIEGDSLDEKFDGYVALFGAANGTIKDLTVSGEVNGLNAAGIVARANAGCVIERCVNNVNVTGKSNGKAGGIVCLTNPSSETNTVTIKDCINNGTVMVGQNGLGGIAGYVNKYSIIDNCTNNGDIGSTSDRFAGGIAGYVTGMNPSIKNSKNTGKISALANAGGIAGIITGNSNDSTIDSTIIDNCENKGEVKGSDSSCSGGILGSLNAVGSVIDCRNYASVYGKVAGGVVGVTGGTGEKNGRIINCNGGTSEITSPAFTLSFTNQSFQLEIEENESAGRVIGANGGSGPNGWIEISVAEGDGYDGIRTVGICGIYTTWANLKIIGGNFHGDPLAGNETYILLSEGTWDGKPTGKYVNGGLGENRKEVWTLLTN